MDSRFRIRYSFASNIAARVLVGMGYYVHNNALLS
jgi:hypothetical protein